MVFLPAVWQITATIPLPRLLKPIKLSPSPNASSKKPKPCLAPKHSGRRTVRKPPSPQQENSVDRLMTQLRSYPVYYWTEKVLSILFTGYIPTSKEAPLFYIGPMNATISGNTLEGPRIRAGGMTTAWLNPHLFGKGYVAYGFKDERVKGLAELEYSFKKKKEYANEFPIHSLKLRYESDVNQYGQNYLYTSKDNVFLALKREKDDRIGYFRQAEMTYINEFYSGFSFQLTARTRKDESSYLIPFLKKEGDAYTPVKDFSISAAELKTALCSEREILPDPMEPFPCVIGCTGVYPVSYPCRKRRVG